MVSRTFQLTEYADVMFQRFELSVVHLFCGLAFGYLAAKVTQIDRKIWFEMLHLVDELFEVRFVASCAAAQQMGIGIQSEAQRC